jgi:hypothetical protein
MQERVFVLAFKFLVNSRNIDIIKYIGKRIDNPSDIPVELVLLRVDM